MICLDSSDYIDIVKDSVTGGDYKKEEDPKLYKSKKTGRGPLSEEWRQEYGQALRTGNRDGKEMMTAYKLCRVEFKYWGMQNKIERFIHDIGEFKVCGVLSDSICGVILIFVLY